MKEKNNKTLKEIHSFLKELEFLNQTPDFIGAWISKYGVETFGAPIYKSYILGFNKASSSIVIDSAGISSMDPLITKGTIIQNYDEEKCHTSMISKILRYYPEKNIKKSEFDKNFSIINQWDGDYTTGNINIINEDPWGIFIFLQNNENPLFHRLAKEMARKIKINFDLL